MMHERLLRQVVDTLHLLARCCEVGGYYKQACEAARRQG